MPAQSLSVVIPNWNGEKVLGLCLRSVAQALEWAAVPPPWDIVVSDDGSTDGSVPLLHSEFPEVRVVASGGRGGFIANANRGISACAGTHFLLLNNDVTLDKSFFVDWTGSFKESEVFSVTCRMLRPDGETFDSGRRVGVWDRGLIRHWVVCSEGSPGPTLFSSGGASFYDASRFRDLGGFDPLYRPMYLEDMDISYMAWKRGWSSQYEPCRVASHHGSISSRRVYSSRTLETLIARNHHLFVWKNVTDPTLIRWHLSRLPYWLCQGWRPGRRLVTLGLLQALSRLPEALRRRAEERSQQVVADTEIWSRFSPTAEDLRSSPYMGLAGTA